ncbi:PAS domain S-box protein [Candidatus Kryptonium thompsonii]|uniref:PAS domain S-box protein n=1 Tax=Candidatus Kryptonium thompsonii TaxID=1633631 RepID=UPI00070758FB|nr:PAS domain S-box protein [Candidatus Kryptonium thompsoni]CUT06285.1 PAS domain S-box-containing protein [Candidatus Kryptonium thompsoni]
MKPPNSSNNLSKYEQSFADFACDYSIKARAIASVSLALTFIALNFIFKLSLPIHIFTIAALFQSLINQPYRFLRNLLKSSDKVLFITNIIDIIVISIVVYYVGGLSFTFAGFLYLIVIVFNGIFGGTTRALVLAILSSLAVIFLYIFETLEILYHPTLITFQISELQKVVLLISYIAIFFIFAVLAHIPSQKLRNELIKQHKITAELEQQYFITEILYKITNTVIRAESIEEVYQQTLDGITKALNINKASILLFDPDGVMRFKAWVGLSENYRKAVEGHSPWKPDDPNPQPIFISNVEKDKTLNENLKKIILNEGIRSLGFIPLVFRGKLLGKFMIYYEQPHEFTQREITLILAIAIQISLSIGRKLIEIELTNWRDKFEKIVLAMKEVVYEWDFENDTTTWEGDLEAIFGIKKEELKERKFSWQEFIHPDDVNLIMSKINDAIKGTASTLETEYRIRRKDGSSIYCLDYAYIIRDENGKAIKTIGIIFDITTLKETEQKLLKREKVLKVINYAAGILIKTIDWEKEIGKLIEALGESAEVNSVYLFKNQERNGELTTGLVARWYSSNLEKQVEDSQLQNISYKLSGFERWLDVLGRKEVIHGFVKNLPFREYLFLSFLGVKSILVVPIFVGDKWWGFISLNDCRIERKWDEAEINAIKTFADILGLTIQRSENEKALRESEQRYRKLFEDSKDPIYISTPEGKLVDVNPAFVELFGYSSKEEILKVDIPTELYENPEDRKKNLEAIETQGYIKDYELHLKTKDGRKLIVYDTSTPIYDDKGNIIAYQGILRDVTKIKMLEQQLLQSQKMESLGRLTAGIAHDINNALTVILGNTQLAKRLLTQGDIEKVNEKFTEIENTIRRTGEFTKKLLIFSREQPAVMKISDLNSIVNDFTKVMLKALRENIKIELILAPKLPNVKVDPALINQLLLNLIINAQEAIYGEGRIIIETYTRYIDQEYCDYHLEAKPGEYVVLSVSDTGIGISKEILPRIFEPFFTTKEHGTGLGLSIVYGIVKQHGGFINVYSEVNQGTIFRIYFPAVYEYEEEREAKEEAKPEIKGGTETILIAEDEEKLRTTVIDMLQSLGYKVYSASNGLEAIEIFKEKANEIDLVFLDIVMPVLGGYEAMKEIVKIKPSIKVIFATGYSLNGLNLEFIKGFDLIQKPYSYETIAVKVREVLDRK